MATPISHPDAIQADHVVVLIPGFLGFNKFGDHGYFNATVGNELTAALKRANPGRSIGVVGANTIPAGSLATRQASLIAQLQEMLRKNPRAQFHLVGHSTGGLDAELLARTPRPGAERDDDTEKVRKAIRSIVTIASPLAGTSLASSPAAKLLSIDSLMDVQRLGRASLAKLLFQVPSDLVNGAVAAIGLVSDNAARDVVYNLFHDLPAASSYVRSLAIMRSLVSDLEIDSVVDIMTKETREDPSLQNIHRARFLTIAPETEKPNLLQQFFNLYEFFYTNTKKYAKQSAFTDAVKRALEAQRIPVIASRSTSLPPLDAGASDAIVNTLRQVAPGNDATIAREVSRVRAFVVADHIDVVGYYPGKDGRDNGFLNSGAKFRDAEFSALYGAVANEISIAIQGTEGEAFRSVPPS